MSYLIFFFIIFTKLFLSFLHMFLSESSIFFSHIYAYVFIHNLVEKTVQTRIKGVYWNKVHRDDMRHGPTMYELLYYDFYNHVFLIGSSFYVG